MQTAHFKSTTEAIKSISNSSVLQQLKVTSGTTTFTAQMSSFCLLSSQHVVKCSVSLLNKITSWSDAALRWSPTVNLWLWSLEPVKKKGKISKPLEDFLHLMVVKVCVRRGGNSDEATLSRNWDDHKGKQRANILTVHRSLCIKHAASQPTPSLTATSDAGTGSKVELHVVLKDNSGAREQECATGISQVRSRTNPN